MTTKTNTPTSSIETITPEYAERTLQTANPNNRNLNKANVQKLAGAIERGEWRLNGEPLIFSSDDVLIDGQHRMAAVAQAGIPTPFLVVRGVESEAMTTIDTGRSRSAGDVLRMDGKDNTFILAAAARLLFAWEHYGKLSTRLKVQPTNPQLLDVVREHPGLEECVKLVRQHTPRISGYAVAFYYLAWRASDEDEVNAFMEGLLGGLGLGRDDPRLLWRERVLGGVGTRLDSDLVNLGLIKVWNLWRAGKPAKRLILIGQPWPAMDGDTLRNSKAGRE